MLPFEFHKTLSPARGNVAYHACGGMRQGVTLIDETEFHGTQPGAIRHNTETVQYPLDYAPLMGTDEWNEVELELRGGRVRTVINGVEVQNALSEGRETSGAESATSTKTSRLGFTVFQGELQFRNLQIWEDPDHK